MEQAASTVGAVRVLESWLTSVFEMPRPAECQEMQFTKVLLLMVWQWD